MKDKQVAAIIAEIEKQFGSLDGVRVKWDDGRVFVHKNGRWTVEK